MAEQPDKPSSRMLSYRAVVWQWTVGVAPKWADLLLILVAGAAVFVAMMMMLMAAVAMQDGTWRVVWVAVPVSLFAWGIVGLIWFWSMHFRHRAPMSTAEAEEDEIPLASVASKPEPPTESNAT
jgi:hypothetical protein